MVINKIEFCTYWCKKFNCFIMKEYHQNLKNLYKVQSLIDRLSCYKKN